MVQDQTGMFLSLNHHPVCAAVDASHFFLVAQPPLLARRGNGSPLDCPGMCYAACFCVTLSGKASFFFRPRCGNNPLPPTMNP